MDYSNDEDDECLELFYEFKDKFIEIKKNNENKLNKKINALTAENNSLTNINNELVNKLSIIELYNNNQTLEDYKLNYFKLVERISDKDKEIEDLKIKIDIYDCELDRRNKKILDEVEVFKNFDPKEKDEVNKALLIENSNLKETLKKFKFLEEDFRLLEEKYLTKFDNFSLSSTNNDINNRKNSRSLKVVK